MVEYVLALGKKQIADTGIDFIISGTGDIPHIRPIGCRFKFMPPVPIQDWRWCTADWPPGHALLPAVVAEGFEQHGLSGPMGLGGSQVIFQTQVAIIPGMDRMVRSWVRMVINGLLIDEYGPECKEV
jgi:hypothetical protein